MVTSGGKKHDCSCEGATLQLKTYLALCQFAKGVASAHFKFGVGSAFFSRRCAEEKKMIYEGLTSKHERRERLASV